MAWKLIHNSRIFSQKEIVGENVEALEEEDEVQEGINWSESEDGDDDDDDDDEDMDDNDSN